VAAPLVCPACGTGAPLTERFCAACGSPLVHAGAGPGEPPLEHAADERRIYARKVHPPYAEGELVRVAGARHLAEAELIQGLLLEAGVPSMTRRARGFDVPDFLAAGPRDILVPAGGADAALDMLRPHDFDGDRISWNPDGTWVKAPVAAGAPRPFRRRRPPWMRAGAMVMALMLVALLAAVVALAVHG
jgi:hypothetical protein